MTFNMPVPIVTNSVAVSTVTLALLASYIVQSELGDYDTQLHRAGYLKEFKFIPNQPSDLELEIAELHAMHTGLTPEDVELRYLEKAKWLTGYGVDIRRVTDCHGAHLKLGNLFGPRSLNLGPGFLDLGPGSLDLGPGFLSVTKYLSVFQLRIPIEREKRVR
eukprot:sb/3472766/